jgi:hypothetical protein
MKTNAKLLLWTTGTSFIASLSLGSPNLRVAGLAFRHDLKNTMLFCLMAVIVQMCMSGMVLMFAAKYNKIKRLTDMLVVITVVMMILLAARILKAESDESHFFLPPEKSGISILISGALYGLISCTRAPSWLAWLVILKCKHWLDSASTSSNYYISAIGLGVLLSFTAYALAGLYLTDHLIYYHHILSKITSALLIILAIKRVLTVFRPGFILFKK